MIIVGTNLSKTMLAKGAATAREEKISNLSFLRSDAQSLPLQDTFVDIVICCGALYLFTDARGAVAEVARIRKPQDRFSLSLYLAQSDPLSLWKVNWDREVWGVRAFFQTELKELLEDTGSTATIYYAKGIWMIPGGIKQEENHSPQRKK